MTVSWTLAALVLAAAPATQTWILDPAKSSVRFHVQHALHEVEGEDRAIEAKALVGADGQVRAMARVQIAAMRTGDANRDANMRAVLEADRYPYVVLKATGPFTAPASLPASGPLRLSGELELHGVRRPVEVPLQVAFDESGAAHLTGGFTVSLEAHRIERPSLLFQKVADECRIQVDLLLRPEKN